MEELQKEEITKVAELLKAANDARGIPAKIEKSRDLFTYLLTTSEVLKNALLRKALWLKSYEFETYPELIDVCQELQEKLLTYGPAEPRPLGKAPVSPNLRYIAKGSYGCAIGPALPNIVSGSWKTYPSNVTKLFYDKHNYDKLLAKQPMIHNVFGKINDYTIHPYIHKFTYRNIPSKVRANCDIGSQDLHIVRMPHLGTSVHDTTKDSAKYRPILKAIPIPTLLNEIMKLFGNVKTLRDKNLIHGDIRETNLMIDPNTGKLTIIDFDWLLPKDTFLAEYGGFGFYNNPPEALMVDRIANLERIGFDGVFFNELNSDGEAQEYIKHSNRYKYRDDLGLRINASTIAIANMKNLKYIPDLIKLEYANNTTIDIALKETVLKQNMIKTFDSYGLGITLAALLYVVYPEEFTAESNKTIHSLIHTIIKPMIALEMKDRMGIEEAIGKMETLQASLAGASEAAEGGGNRIRKKTRSANRRKLRKTRKNRK